MSSLPSNDKLTICFAHVAYAMHERFLLRKMGANGFQVRDLPSFEARIGEADVVVVSGMWRNEFLAKAPKLKLIQSISAGTDQYDRARIAAAGVRLASAQGVNERAVSEHAMSLILAIARQLHYARDNQMKQHWRGMIGDIPKREDEMGGKTLLIVGMGRIGGRLAQLGKAFGMHVIGTKRDLSTGKGAADELVPDSDLMKVVPRADYVALTCPLTPQTEKLIGAAALAAMKPGAYLVNVARGKVVDEPALIEALQSGKLIGAALDCTVEEPLPASSPLWAMPNVIITPHTAGETQKYEDNVLDLMVDNIGRLQRGETALKNQIV